MRQTLLLLALTVPTSASGQGYSTDIELIQPSFSDGAIYAVKSPRIAAAGTIRAGGVLQYEDDPLVLWEGPEVGSVVASRAAWALGANYAMVDERLSFGLVVPGAASWGSEVPTLAADGAALGDLKVDMTVMVAKAGPVYFGANGVLALPIGTQQAFTSEGAPRGMGSLLAMLDVGPLEVIADGGITGRAATITSEDYIAMSVLHYQLGTRVFVYQEVVGVQAMLHSSAGTAFFSDGGAENAREWLAGVQVNPSSTVTIDLGGGTGLFSDGVGSTELRLFSSVVWHGKPQKRERPEPEPEFVVEEVPIVETLPDEEILELPPPPPPAIEWQQGELARIQEDKIIIRDPIQFEFGTDMILPISIATLEYVAKLMNDDARIAHLVIEGHASEEGSYEYNFNLSNLRSKAVFREVIRAGVHPDRLSYRGMGEVVPVQMGPDEASLAANRRVEFKIVTQLAPGDDFPAYAEQIKLPWSGEAAKMNNPEPPPPPAPPEPQPTEPIDPLDSIDFGQSDDDFQFDGEQAPPPAGDDAAKETAPAADEAGSAEPPSETETPAEADPTPETPGAPEETP